jgi:hypothetical protein
MQIAEHFVSQVGLPTPLLYNVNCGMCSACISESYVGDDNWAIFHTFLSEVSEKPDLTRRFDFRQVVTIHHLIALFDA